MNAFKVAEIRVHALSPVLADIRLTVEGDLLPGDEIKGRLLGPRNPLATTVEVAYIAKPLTPQPARTFQVIIPEPSLWEPHAPFVYEGAIELWRGGKRVESAAVSVGLHPSKSPRLLGS